MKYYKVLRNGKAKDGGSFDYSEYVKSGAWTPVIHDVKHCESGYHLTTNPFNWLENGNQVFLCEGREVEGTDDDKRVCRSIRFINELSSEEIKKLSKEFNKIDFAKVKKDLGNISTKVDVIKLLKRVQDCDWFKPQKPDKALVKLKVQSVLKAFKLDLSVSVSWHQLKKQSDWASAWASARDSAWASARASVWDSAWASARASARDSAWASARASAWASARDSAWASARASAWASARASARASVWDSAWACEFEVVKDLMKKEGYEVNPFALLFELWEMGLYPAGLLEDGKFHVWYVPLKKVKEK